MTAGIWSLVQFVLGLVGMGAEAHTRLAAHIVATVERLVPGGEEEDDTEQLRQRLAALEYPTRRRVVYELVREVMAPTPAKRATWGEAVSEWLSDGKEPGSEEDERLLELVRASDVNTWCALAAGASAVAGEGTEYRNLHPFAMWTVAKTDGDRRVLLAQLVVVVAITNGSPRLLAEFMRAAIS